MSADASYKSA